MRGRRDPRCRATRLDDVLAIGGYDTVSRPGRSERARPCRARFLGRHIHIATEEALDAELDPDDFAEVTDAYATYEEALVHFIRMVNVSDASKHFSKIIEVLPLFKDARQR